jgi:hypothetical protein
VREIRLHGSEGGGIEINRSFLPRSIGGVRALTDGWHTLRLWRGVRAAGRSYAV